MTETHGYKSYSNVTKHKKPPPRSGGSGSFVAIFKSVKLLKLLKAAKAMKFLLSFGSMVLSVFAYSFAMGWVFSIGFVVMLFCHETGHAVALRSKGMKASLPVFIPFLGAAIFAPKLGDRHEEAYMAFAGPLIGTASAVALFGATLLVPGTHPLLLGIAFTALIINLFNMIPLSPLDGGRITQAIGPWFRYVGIAALLVLTVVLATPGLLVIWVLVLTDMHARKGLRLVLGLIVETIAIVMMMGHIGQQQPFWLNVTDLVLMSVLNLLFAWSWTKNRDTFHEETDTRPALSREMRNRWFVAYVALLVFLVVMMAYVRHALPAYVTA